LGIRGDGNSRFGSAYRYGLFPSISAKWILSDEPFMRPLKIFSSTLVSVLVMVKVVMHLVMIICIMGNTILWVGHIWAMRL
jgi:hypothetical protein